ncbi:hypothetical protein Pcinc_026130 [Petrolisthes cinctipes]|uniref:Secreted protein n=1 Tax=Petrolisthes cinctipes TaxID=88211 RepID=A0AAE1F7X8_PETCI|nr:hypothetical protein Pcinc_026130 [Petrolisthes cinctipes]
MQPNPPSLLLTCTLFLSQSVISQLAIYPYTWLVPPSLPAWLSPLPIHLNTHLDSTHPPASQPTCLPLSPPACLSAHLPTSQPTCLPLRPPAYL